VDEVEPLEGVVSLNSAEEMNSAFLAGIAEDGGAFIHDFELLLVGRDLDVVNCRIFSFDPQYGYVLGEFRVWKATV